MDRSSGSLRRGAALRWRQLSDQLTPSERSIVAFLIGWAVLGAFASLLPWTAGFSSDGRRRITIPPEDPRAALHARSAVLAAHLALARTPPEAPLDPNRASREELDRLPGVGPKTARRWLEVRASQGPFLAFSDLARVRGLGPKRIAKLSPYLKFSARQVAGRSSGAAARVNVNRATRLELAALPGVGPVLAARIVEHRLNHGRFKSLNDLDSVSGMGPAMLRKLKGEVRFE